MSTLLDRQRERFQADPSDLRAFEALEESRFVSGEWNGLVELYWQRLAAPDFEASPRERGRLLLRLGQILTDRLEDPGRGAKAYHAAIKADPTSRAALTELRGLHVRRDQWEVALQIAEVESGMAMSSEERAALFSEVGGIWLHQLGDPEQALDQFRRALEAVPSQIEALEGSARANHSLRRPAEAVVFWEQLAARHSGKERASALVAWAGLLTGSLNDPTRAADLYRRALTHDPANRDALEALAAIAEAGEQWELLVDLYERAYELTDASEQRAALALAVGRVLLDQLENVDAARVWLKRSAELDANDPLVHRCLADVERIRADDAALLDELQHQVECSGDRPPISCLLELGSLLAAAGRDEEALARLQCGLEVAPENSAVVEEISNILSRLGRHEELVEVMERRSALAISDPATYAIVLAELGEVQEKQLDDTDSARSTYERAMQADPTCPGVAASLERIYRKTEAWGPLRGLLEQAGRSALPEERAAYFSALGSLLDERFEDRNAAARAFESALALDGSCREAHRGRQRLATSGGDEDAILEAYENEAGIASDPARLGQLVREMAPRLEARDRTDDALRWANRWIVVAPEDVDALRLGARLREEMGQDEELLDLLQRLDPLLQSGEQAANRRRIGALHAAHERHEPAIDAYRSGLEVDPADVITLEALVDELEQANRPAELAAALQNPTDLQPEERRATSLDHLSRLLEERLGDLPGAIDALVRLSEIDAAAPQAETRLEPLLERAGRFEELVERLERRIHSMPEAGRAARALRLRHAGVMPEHLSRFAEAVAAYRSILGEDPD
ncbi:MAG: tetratricopeptide repeat protein, partial [Myxococcales bacterium]|nr:tetratricopeptide repeat protein [Myxococcales bacterium]